MINKTISILGCGWYGLAVAKNLVSQGYTVKGSTTSEIKLDLLAHHGILPFLINFDAEGGNYDGTFFESEVLIISLPPKRNLGQHKEYPEKINRIVQAARQSGMVSKILMISSTSVYADVNREVGQSELPVPDTESGLSILEAEQIIKSFDFFRSTVLRFGGLIGPGRNLAKFFSGKRDIANGLAPVNLLHLDDCIKLTLHILKVDAFGYTFNICSPDHPTRMEMYTNAASVSGMEPPNFLPELGKWKLINGNEVSTKLKFKYLVNNWSEFLVPDKL
jgi:nucleoside-diphosphate-sugar epimerase